MIPGSRVAPRAECTRVPAEEPRPVRAGHGPHVPNWLENASEKREPEEPVRGAHAASACDRGSHAPLPCSGTHSGGARAGGGVQDSGCIAIGLKIGL